MSELAKRLREIERSMHEVWSEHCAGAPCKEKHKKIWNDIQQGLLDAAKQLERWGES